MNDVPCGSETDVIVIFECEQSPRVARRHAAGSTTRSAELHIKLVVRLFLSFFHSSIILFILELYISPKTLT
jgi:hypothetical protein